MSFVEAQPSGSGLGEAFKCSSPLLYCSSGQFHSTLVSYKAVKLIRRSRHFPSVPLQGPQRSLHLWHLLGTSASLPSGCYRCRTFKRVPHIPQRTHHGKTHWQRKKSLKTLPVCAIRCCLPHSP